MTQPTMLAVPNVSEGRDGRVIGRIGRALANGDGGGVRLLDVHSDADHGRSVFTFAAGPGALGEAMLRLAGAAVEGIDVGPAGRPGQHPHVGALDVAPVVYLRPEDRGAACAEALVIAERIACELEVPVFLYGELTAAGEQPARTRAWLRRGGVAALAERMGGGGEVPEPLAPDFGPRRAHPTAGATLVGARPPLVAFNLQLAPPATLADARRVAAIVREGGTGGLAGVRAIGVELAGGVAQVSMNVERPLETPLAEVLAVVMGHAAVAEAELVGLAPAAALAGFPGDLPIRGFDAARQVIENALVS